jgi:hypothetical protein
VKQRTSKQKFSYKNFPPEDLVEERQESFDRAIKNKINAQKTSVKLKSEFGGFETLHPRLTMA